MAITADYYVDPVNGSDSNAGTSTGAAFATWQKGLNLATAGDIIALKGSGVGADETVSSAINFVTGGNSTDGYIKSVGVNSLWEDDGTRYLIDGENIATNCLYGSGIDYQYIKNVELCRAKDAGLDFSNNVFGFFLYENVVARLNGGKGFDTYYDGHGSVFLRCGAFNNGSDGFFSIYYVDCSLVLCVAGNNSGCGFYNERLQAYGCLSYGNNVGFRFNDSAIIYNCVIDGSTTDGILGASNGNNTSIILGCRLTNNGGYGINSSVPKKVFEDYNYYYNNTSGLYQAGIMSGGNSKTGSEAGYNDPSTNDYNLTASAILKGDEYIELP